MKKYLSFIAALFCTANLFGQTPYQGGLGDGYAMVSLQLETVSSVEAHVQLLKIYPTIAVPNQTIYIQSPLVFETVTLVDISGNAFVLNGNSTFKLPEQLQSGVYHLIAKDQQQVYFSKIVVMDN
jgi:hypothetical protein